MTRRLNLALLLLVSLPVWAADTELAFGPADTTIHWTLNTRLHTVHGTFALKEGHVRFDRATGSASGELIVDSFSGQSGSSSRDARMHSSVLESPKFATIVFHPHHVNGQIPDQGAAKLDIVGTFDLHGASHDLTIPIEVDVTPSSVGVKSKFNIPYVAWGLKDPSEFMLKVDKAVQIELTSTARLK
jgi:polyisoprenoid-binding protein YceI